MNYHLPSEWTALIQVSLCTLPPSRGLQHRPQWHNGFLVSQLWLLITRGNSVVFIAMGIFCHVQIQATQCLLRRCVLRAIQQLNLKLPHVNLKCIHLKNGSIAPYGPSNKMAFQTRQCQDLNHGPLELQTTSPLSFRLLQGIQIPEHLTSKLFVQFFLHGT
jgi:hypothetical protein